MVHTARRAVVTALMVSLIGLGAACGSSGTNRSAASSGSSGPQSSAQSTSTGQSGAGTTAASSSSSTNSSTDPCSFASKEQVAAAIGTSISLAKTESPTQCGYFPTDSATSNGLYIEVTDAGAYDAFKQTLRNTTPVSGVGDDAFWAPPILRVKAGSHMIVINVMDTTWNGGDSQGAAVAVARVVLPRV